MAAKYRTTPLLTSEMPPGIPYIIGNEAAERFSYYGMSAILFAFLTEHLRTSIGQRGAHVAEHRPTNGSTTSSRPFTRSRFVGAILSDWLLGKYRTIMSVSLLYCVGHAVLAFMDFPHDHGHRSEDGCSAWGWH